MGTETHDRRPYGDRHRAGWCVCKRGPPGAANRLGKLGEPQKGHPLEPCDTLIPNFWPPGARLSTPAVLAPQHLQGSDTDPSSGILCSIPQKPRSHSWVVLGLGDRTSWSGPAAGAAEPPAMLALLQQLPVPGPHLVPCPQPAGRGSAHE